MKKKTRIIGTEPYIHQATGELIDLQLVESYEAEKDGNFYKLFLNDFISALDSVANQKIHLCFFLISNLSKDNLLLFTYRQLADKTGISYATVADTMKTLQSADFLRKHETGYYMVNPGIIYKGSYQRRCHALREYAKCITCNDVSADEKRLQNMNRDIARLQKKADNIRRYIDIAKSDL